MRTFLPFFCGLFLVAACANSVETRVLPGPAGTTDGTVPTAYDAESFCGALCDRTLTCDQALDVQTCKNSCTNSYAAVFPKLRGDVVSLIVGCFDAKDCKTVLAGDVVSTCIADAVASVAPTDAANAFCDAKVKAKKKCSVTITKADCLNEAKLYGDGAIAQAQNCTARPCGEIDTCVAASFGSLGKTTPTQPSDGSCTGFTDLASCRSCAETSCCAQAAACGADPQCRAMMNACTYATGSATTCQQVGASAPSSSQSLAQEYFSCAQSSCSSTCRFVLGTP